MEKTWKIKLLDNTLLRKIPGSFKMPFELKFCSFLSVPSLFKKEFKAFDSAGIE